MKCEFSFSGLPPSYNRHFKINYNFRQVYLSNETRSFKNKVKMLCPVWNVDTTNKLKLSVIYYSESWYAKNGNIRRKDIQNLDKLLIDALSEKLGINDSQFFEVHLYKVQSNISVTAITMEKIG